MAVLATTTWTDVNGAAWPSSQWTTAISGAGVVNVDGLRGRLTSIATNYSSGNKAYLSGMAATRDIDLTVDVTFPVIAEMYFSIVLRGPDTTATAEPSYGYGVLIYPGNGVNSLGFMEWNGTANNISTPADLPAGQWVANTPRRVRVRAVGNQMQVKVWDPAAPEPATWLWTGTDSTYAANTGRVYFQIGSGGGSTARTVYVDNLVVTDGVDSAPAFSGSLALTGDGPGLTLSAPRVTVSQSLALTGSGTVGAVASRVTTSGSLSLSGAGGQATSAARPGVNGSLTASGSGTMTLGTGKLGAAATLALASTGALSITSQGNAVGSLAASGSGTLAFSGARVTTSRTLSLTGSGSLPLSAARVTVPATGPLVLTGSGTLSAAGSLTSTGTAALTGSGSLALTAARVTTTGSLALTSNGTLSVADPNKAPVFYFTNGTWRPVKAVRRWTGRAWTGLSPNKIRTY